MFRMNHIPFAFNLTSLLGIILQNAIAIKLFARVCIEN